MLKTLQATQLSGANVTDRQHTAQHTINHQCLCALRLKNCLCLKACLLWILTCSSRAHVKFSVAGSQPFTWECHDTCWLQHSYIPSITNTATAAEYVANIQQSTAHTPITMYQFLLQGICMRGSSVGPQSESRESRKVSVSEGGYAQTQTLLLKFQQ